MYNNNEKDQEEIFSKVLRAGRRTYFFDVRETKASDYYLTIKNSPMMMERSTTKNTKSISTKRILVTSVQF